MIKEKYGDSDTATSPVILDLENWMSDLPEELQNLPIICLAIPGTHDSGSSSITRMSPIAPDSGPLVRRLGKIFGPIVKFLVYNWVVTQQTSLTEQLKYGIRYFDLRVATKKNCKELYFVHGLYGSEISSLLQEVRAFLDTHQGEVVILDFQHFYNFSIEDHSQLVSLLDCVFNGMICPAISDVKSISLSWMIEKGFQVIVIYRDAAGQGFWPARRWPTPWPDTTSPQKMLTFLTETLNRRPAGSGFVSQCVLTPNIKFVLCNPLSTLKKTCGEPCNRAVLPWIEKQCPGPAGINVIIADFVHTKGFPFTETVILLNLRLLRNNRESEKTNYEMEIYSSEN
ncbi:PI-PLC X domain-containing protein 3 isoform X1 [Schistocerca piceifrons]|uniref:PI-PLC X domain-containing protein 3 isoform X1 n=2 Tax=Schistocerca piceifrons TaxID=274613 RepID=UPI001F5F6BEA|nr:PI-PLC X domain-containing protein 3 isoform X1 [Schistocerca piceifrons]